MSVNLDIILHGYNPVLQIRRQDTEDSSTYLVGQFIEKMKIEELISYLGVDVLVFLAVFVYLEIDF